MIYDLHNTFLEPSGNIFVDQGQLTLKILLNKPASEKVSIQDILNLQGSGDLYGFPWLAENIIRFKSYSMIYTMNHPRTQSGFKPANQKIFVKLLEVLSVSIKNEFDPSITKPYICDICGKPHNFDFDKEYREILRLTVPNYAEKVTLGKEEPKFPCREFFPLAGTMGNESQAFSNMSVALNICPRCLLMIYYLPFSSQVIEGNLAIFQISNERAQYNIINIVIAKYLTKIENAGAGDPYENVGKELKNKNELIFDNFLTLFKKLLPDSPTRQDFQKNFPEKAISYWLWKYTNSGQTAFLAYESIPGSSVLFIYLCYCLELSESLRELVKQETKDLKFSQRQIYNRIRSKTLYEFEKLDTKKYTLNKNLPLLYYYYIISYSKDEITSLIKIAQEFASKASNFDDLMKILKDRNRTPVLINQSARELLESGSLSLKDYQMVFTLIPNAFKYKLSRDIIIQMLKLKLSQTDFDAYDRRMKDLLESDALLEYNNARNPQLTLPEQIILRSAKAVYDYFKHKKLSDDTIKNKIIKKQLKYGNISWFASLFANIILSMKCEMDYSWFSYLLESAGGWYNLRTLYQNIFTAWVENPEKNLIRVDEDIQIPADYSRNSKNILIDKILEAYLDHRITKQRKGIPYMKEKFILPYIQGKITNYSLQNFLYEHAQDNPTISKEDKIAYVSTDWEEMLISPKTGKQENSYFTNYVKIFIANYMRQHIDKAIQEKEDKKLALIEESIEPELELPEGMEVETEKLEKELEYTEIQEEQEEGEEEENQSEM